eukprot:TRINITY_DN25789_c0_g2_i2.p2 TRINITY_DN25789_c0_g2~~TRINITY_DN25789_c0_g2_i2.p2  ORF type:complete len:193 (-),score=58.17 TRINITY_DN25789_c0_g2_i2:165-743(-)
MCIRDRYGELRVIGMADSIDLKGPLFEYMRSRGDEDITPKGLRRALEATLGLEHGSLDPRKAEVKSLAEEFLLQQQEEEEEEEEESDEEPPPAKKVKKEPVQKAKPEKKNGADGEKKEKTFAVETRGGEEAPRNLGKTQHRAMKGTQFLGCGETIEIELFGNTLKGWPRQFSSGGFGWYTCLLYTSPSPRDS